MKNKTNFKICKTVKKYFYPIVIMAAAMSALCFVSCHKENVVEEDSIIQSKGDVVEEDSTFSQEPDTIEVKDFLNSVFPNIATECLYDLESDEDTIVRVVNSLEVFKAHYLGEAAIPDINFDDSVLICGRVLMPECPYYVKSMEIKDNAEGSRLTIHTVEADGTWCVLYHMGFWGLFPKKQYDITAVDVIKEKRQ